MAHRSALEVLVPVVSEHRLLSSGSSCTCRLGGSPLQVLLGPIHIPGSRVQALIGLCKQPNACFSGGGGIVVECLVDLEVNLRKREQSAVPYI